MSKRQMVRRRIRCMGHIINLCAQTFIIGKDAENVCKELETALREDDVKKIRELWRKRGSIGRLHNIIRYIRASPQRRNRFAKIVIRGELANFDNLEVSIRVRVILSRKISSLRSGFSAPKQALQPTRALDLILSYTIFPSSPPPQLLILHQIAYSRQPDALELILSVNWTCPQPQRSNPQVLRLRTATNTRRTNSKRCALSSPLG